MRLTESQIRYIVKKLLIEIDEEVGVKAKIKDGQDNELTVSKTSDGKISIEGPSGIKVYSLIAPKTIPNPIPFAPNLDANIVITNINNKIDPSTEEDAVYIKANAQKGGITIKSPAIDTFLDEKTKNKIISGYGSKNTIFNVSGDLGELIFTQIIV